MTNVYNAWKSGGVNRWHQHDNPNLRNSGDTNWGHSARVAQLVVLLGGDERDIVAALFHDAPEKKTGDKRGGTKTAAEHAAEADAARSMGLYYPKTPLVDLCDKLDACLWARLHGSGNSPAWQKSLLKIDKMAFDLGHADQVTEIVTQADFEKRLSE